MGKIENKNSKRRKKQDMQRLVLDTVATTGVLSAALVAPNAIGAMKKMKMLPSSRQKESIQRARDRLVAKGLLKHTEQNFLQLTQEGQRVLKRMQTQEDALKKPKRWDGRWRILIFDIPEYRKSVRDKLRRSLQAVGFIFLQDSVWVYPYDCENFIALLKADFKVGKDMRYIIADTIENDTSLKKTFGLR